MSDSEETLVGTVRRLLRRRDDRPAHPAAPRLDNPPESLRDCPGCGEQVHVLAVRCRHCGRGLDLRAG